jgi:hypothetical protein
MTKQEKRSCQSLVPFRWGEVPPRLADPSGALVGLPPEDGRPYDTDMHLPHPVGQFPTPEPIMRYGISMTGSFSLSSLEIGYSPLIITLFGTPSFLFPCHDIFLFSQVYRWSLPPSSCRLAIPEVFHTDQLSGRPPKKLALVNHRLLTPRGRRITPFSLLTLLFDFHSQRGFRRLAFGAGHLRFVRLACAGFLAPVGLGQDFRKILLCRPLGRRRRAEGREAIIHERWRGH